MRAPFLILVALMFSAVSKGQGFDGWFGGDVELWRNERWAARVRGEYRTAGSGRSLPQLRGGPELRFQAFSRVRLIGLFQAIDSRQRSNDWEEYNRIFGAVEVPLTTGRFALTSRTAAERFFGASAPGLARYREMLRVRTAFKYQPYVSTELFAGRHGLMGVRPNAGFLIPLNSHLRLDFGYHFDVRRREYGGNRHIVYTYLRFNRAG